MIIILPKQGKKRSGLFKTGVAKPNPTKKGGKSEKEKNEEEVGPSTRWEKWKIRQMTKPTSPQKEEKRRKLAQQQPEKTCRLRRSWRRRRNFAAPQEMQNA